MLIDEILLTSRLDAIRAPQTVEDVDLLALTAEECARYDCAAEGQPVSVRLRVPPLGGLWLRYAGPARD